MHRQGAVLANRLQGLDASGRPSAGKQLRKAASRWRAGQIVAQLARRTERKASDVVATAGVQTLRPGQKIRLLGAA